MSVNVNQNVEPVKFKNGLTTGQVEESKKVLRKVNVSEICREQNVQLATIHNVLRDQSPNVEDLAKVIIAAKKKLQKKEKSLKAFPL